MYETIVARWSALSKNAKVGLSFGVVTIVALFLAATIWVMREDYQILFSDLTPQDASAIVAELDRMKTPYRLAENATAILTEKEQVYKTRLKLMSKGVSLQGSVGFEIFNNADFGMTEFAQKVNFQRALQGELTRTIMGLDEIRSVRVHLVLPETGLLKKQNAKPKASINIVMRGNSSLTRDQISGIQRLVAAAVPEIEPSAVTVIDQKGVAISQSLDEEIAGGGMAKLETKREIEEYLTQKLTKVMDRVAGPGKAIVSIDVSLSNDHIKVVQENILPLPNTIGQHVGAVSKKRESIQNKDTASKGNDIMAGRLGLSGASTNTSEMEYINGRRIEEIVSAPGAIKRLSVGVMLPDVKDPVALAKLKEVVAMTVGVNPARGDGLVVYSHSLPVDSKDIEQFSNNEFAPSALEEPINKPLFTGGDHEKWLVILFAMLCLALILIQLQKRSKNLMAKKMSPAERENLLEEINRWMRSQGAV